MIPLLSGAFALIGLLAGCSPAAPSNEAPVESKFFSRVKVIGVVEFPTEFLRQQSANCGFAHPSDTANDDNHGAIVIEKGKRMTGVTYSRGDFPKIDYELTLEGTVMKPPPKVTPLLNVTLADV